MLVVFLGERSDVGGKFRIKSFGFNNLKRRIRIDPMRIRRDRLPLQMCLLLCRDEYHFARSVLDLISSQSD